MFNFFPIYARAIARARNCCYTGKVPRDKYEVQLNNPTLIAQRHHTNLFSKKKKKNRKYLKNCDSVKFNLLSCGSMSFEGTLHISPMPKLVYNCWRTTVDA